MASMVPSNIDEEILMLSYKGSFHRVACDGWSKCLRDDIRTALVRQSAPTREQSLAVPTQYDNNVLEVLFCKPRSAEEDMVDSPDICLFWNGVAKLFIPHGRQGDVVFRTTDVLPTMPASTQSSNDADNRRRLLVQFSSESQDLIRPSLSVRCGHKLSISKDSQVVCAAAAEVLVDDGSEEFTSILAPHTTQVFVLSLPFSNQRWKQVFTSGLRQEDDTEAPNESTALDIQESIKLELLDSNGSVVISVTIDATERTALDSADATPTESPLFAVWASTRLTTATLSPKVRVDDQELVAQESVTADDAKVCKYVISRWKRIVRNVTTHDWRRLLREAKAERKMQNGAVFMRTLSAPSLNTAVLQDILGDAEAVGQLQTADARCDLFGWCDGTLPDAVTGLNRASRWISNQRSSDSNYITCRTSGFRAQTYASKSDSDDAFGGAASLAAASVCVLLFKGLCARNLVADNSLSAQLFVFEQQVNSLAYECLRLAGEWIERHLGSAYEPAQGRTGPSQATAVDVYDFGMAASVASICLRHFPAQTTCLRALAGIGSWTDANAQDAQAFVKQLRMLASKAEAGPSLYKLPVAFLREIQTPQSSYEVPISSLCIELESSMRLSNQWIAVQRQAGVPQANGMIMVPSTDKAINRTVDAPTFERVVYNSQRSLRSFVTDATQPMTVKENEVLVLLSTLGSLIKHGYLPSKHTAEQYKQVRSNHAFKIFDSLLQANVLRVWLSTKPEWLHRFDSALEGMLSITPEVANVGFDKSLHVARVHPVDRAEAVSMQLQRLKLTKPRRLEMSMRHMHRDFYYVPTGWLGGMPARSNLQSGQLPLHLPMLAQTLLWVQSSTLWHDRSRNTLPAAERAQVRVRCTSERSLFVGDPAMTVNVDNRSNGDIFAASWVAGVDDVINLPYGRRLTTHIFEVSRTWQYVVIKLVQTVMIAVSHARQVFDGKTNAASDSVDKSGGFDVLIDIDDRIWNDCPIGVSQVLLACSITIVNYCMGSDTLSSQNVKFTSNVDAYNSSRRVALRLQNAMRRHAKFGQSPQVDYCPLSSLLAVCVAYRYMQVCKSPTESRSTPGDSAEEAGATDDESYATASGSDASDES